ncbi:Alpha/Beta hydrolase protein [Phyllosticta citriasiana]|uniref:Alpha/Beta hydrolase protein n=1 Tax=Phyllosticta citriasiana TaxID=595635 RepID=UPI0030FD775C
MGIFRRKALQASAFQSAGSGSDLSGSIPSSGLTFVDNFKGALEAIEEVSQVLDETFKEIEFEGSSSERLEEYQARLNGEADKYANSSLDFCNTKKRWTCDSNDGVLISIAWKCAAGTYDADYTARLQNYEFRLQNSFPPSAGGTTKATTITLVESLDTSSGSSSFPVVVVAIRGTASTVDAMVNLNIAPRTAESFLFPGLEVHAGFLGAAQALDPPVSKCISEVCRASGARHVLFTGHSAGAAVSSFLFLHYRRKGFHDVLPKSSCILFGCPPAFRPCPTALEHDLKPNAGELWLNIINEYDVVSRADRPYVRSLVDLFRSTYGQTPLESTSYDSYSTDTSSTGTAVGQNWAVPLPEYRHYGDLIVLRMSRSDPSPAENRMLFDDELRLEAWKVTSEEFSKLLFTRIAVHRRRYYERAAAMVAKGALST